MRSSTRLWPALAVCLRVFLYSPSAQAVPSFSRQTSLQCAVCHSNPPELTSFGRKFKLEGYTLAAKTPDATIGDEELTLQRYFPLSVMLLASGTIADTHVPGAQAENVQLPQALSLFLAGALSAHVGAMVQVTYSHQSDHLGMDNTDIRYADHITLGSHDLLYGATLNNSPTVEDVWNSTPAWGYPWISPGNVPRPAAAPIISGALAQDVAGLGAYALWDDHLYVGLTLYRSEHAGGPQPLTGATFAFNIQGVAPYWRIAWQQNWGLNYVEIGAYGIHLDSVPLAASGPRDAYTDIAFDLQYERPFGPDLLTVHATYIAERSQLTGTVAAGGAAMSEQHLGTFRADGTYHLRGRYTLTLGGFSTAGSNDPVLFAPAPITGSFSGSPDSEGYVVQAGYWPKQNIELSAAYTGYVKFNGSNQNYDGAGRTASANNSLYLALWLNY